MKYHLVYSDCYGIHCFEIESIEDATKNLTEAYKLFASKVNETSEPYLFYGTKVAFEANVTVECVITA